jgi:hypothetical protein
MKANEIIVEATPKGMRPRPYTPDWNESKDYILKTMKRVDPSRYKDADSYKQFVSRVLLPTLGNNLPDAWFLSNFNIDDADLTNTATLQKKLNDFATKATEEWYDNRVGGGNSGKTNNNTGTSAPTNNTNNDVTIAKALDLIGVKIPPTDRELMKTFASNMATNGAELTDALKKVTGIA